jgi:hypothetical protein
MAPIKFSVPDDVKREFEEAFADEDRNLVVTRLMKQAIVERKRAQTRAAAAEELLKIRKGQKAVSDEQIRRARQAGRP